MSDAWGIHTPFFLLGAIALIVAVYVIALNKRFASRGAEPAPAGPVEIVS
jgi:hypothetical protein